MGRAGGGGAVQLLKTGPKNRTVVPTDGRSFVSDRFKSGTQRVPLSGSYTLLDLLAVGRFGWWRRTPPSSRGSPILVYLLPDGMDRGTDVRIGPAGWWMDAACVAHKTRLVGSECGRERTIVRFWDGYKFSGTVSGPSCHPNRTMMGRLRDFCYFE